jgi:outer membrane PBP1 activator LpoA protein
MQMFSATRTTLILSLGLLAGCSSPQYNSNFIFSNYNSASEQTQKSLNNTAQNYLNRASTQSPTKSIEYKLMAVELLLESKSFEQAFELVNSIPDKGLKSSYQAKKSLLLGQIYLSKNDSRQAIRQIAKTNQDVLNKEDLSKFYLLQAQTYENLNYIVDAARARMKLSDIIRDNNILKKNQYEISRLLSKVPLNQLQKVSQKSDPLEKGWYDLAILKQRFGNNRNQYQQALNNWLNYYSSHPARMTIPSHLLAKKQTVEIEKPKNIALLIPLTGTHKTAAKAIQEGFLAGFYETQGEKPNIRVYDTEQTDNIHALYRKAVNEGANFVVGPLTKKDVYNLSQIPSYSIKTPIVALNNHPDIKHAAAEFFQFALSPEDEAKQLAEKAWQNDYRLASIVVPDNNWGKRTSTAFESHWKLLGGTVSQTVFIGSHADQAAHIRKLLNIDDSQERANKIKRMLKEKIEFQPRRRNDVDLIVLAAPPEQARQLKPLFEFYYANDIPVFATSSIYHGKPNPKKDRDINGIVFCDMPGIIDPIKSQVLTDLLGKYGQTQGDQYARLFAMGVDSYNLTQELNQLKNDPRSRFYGTTGTLSINPNNEVQRELSWAQFKSGLAEKL